MTGEPQETAHATEHRASLTSKILRETSRFAAIQLLSALLGAVAQIALARLLDRRDFGVFAICQFYIGLGQLLGDGGLGATLLRRKDAATVEEYRATLTALLGIAAVFASMLFVFAPTLAAYNQLSPSETNVLRMMAPLYFVGALRVVPYVRLERDLLFSRIARIELVASLTRHTLSLLIAALHGGVWALVWAQLASAIVQLMAAYGAAPGWVGLGFSWRVFRPLIAYGSKVQALSLCAYFKDNLSRALLGRFVGPSGVGLYDFGGQFIQVPVGAVNSLARVQLPVYARFEARDAELHAALRGAMRTALLAGIPLLGALALASSWAVPLVYGAKWLPAFPVIWGLLLNMVCGLVLSPLFTLLQGQGRAGLALSVFACWTTLTWVLALLGLLLWPASLGAVATAQSVATVAITVYLLIWASRHLGRSALSGLGAPLTAGAIAFAAGGALFWFGSGPLAHPVMAVLVFLAVYAAVLFLLERNEIVAEARGIYAAVRSKA
jgi:PST family polysaccharide transporter